MENPTHGQNFTFHFLCQSYAIVLPNEKLRKTQLKVIVLLLLSKPQNIHHLRHWIIWPNDRRVATKI